MAANASPPQMKNGKAAVKTSATIPPRPGPMTMPRNHMDEYRLIALVLSFGEVMSATIVIITGHTIPDAKPCKALRRIS